MFLTRQESNPLSEATSNPFFEHEQFGMIFSRSQANLSEVESYENDLNRNGRAVKQRGKGRMEVCGRRDENHG